MQEERVCGLVVSGPKLVYPFVMQAVFVDSGSPVLFTRRRDFTSYRFSSNQTRKQMEKVDREKSLVPGDWIEFSMPRKGDILDYEKVFPLCKSRVVDRHLQVEAICVFSPWTGHEGKTCVSELFGCFIVPVEISDRFLSDVAFRCWLFVDVDEMTLKVMFGNYISVADDQSFVQATPWNRGDPRFALQVEQEEQTCISKSSVHCSDLPSQLFDACGLLVDSRTVYCSRYAHVPIYLAYVSRSPVASVGDHIRFTAMFSTFLGGYVVLTYRKILSTLSFGFKYSSSGLSAYLEVYVKSAGLPFGYFWTKNKQLGIVHDPEGLLSAVVLSSHNCVFRVYVTDMGPNAFSRFRIKEVASIIGDKCTDRTIDEPVFLEDVMGIAIGNGGVFAPQYGTLRICFGVKSVAGWKNLTSGSWIRFTCASDPRPPFFIVMEWQLVSLQPVRSVRTANGYQFLTSCFFNACLRVLESEIFGFIDDPEQKLPAVYKRGDGAVIRVWVQRGSRRCRTPFIFMSTKDPIS